MKRRRRDALRAADQTVLAFRRTAIQVGLAGLAAVRLLTETFGWWVLAAGVAAVALTLGVQRAAGTYADTVDGSGRVEWAPHGVGHALTRHALVAAGTAAVAALALAWVLMRR